MPITQEDLNNRFIYHTSKGDQSDRYEKIRAAAREYAHVLWTLCPESRELSLAITNLEQATMWGNAAIARNE